MATDAHDTVTAALPTPGAGPKMCMVEVALIEESLTNPRKTFDGARMQDLADSIKASGVHQPILLRPLPGSRLAETFGFRRQGAPLPVYELVAGARRLRACRLAKVAEVPAMIRELTDTEALEIQVIENLQREDVTELEEAEGYEVLMRTGNLNADQVGVKIGKSRSYVYSRLKVLDICQTGRQALREDKLDFSKALLVARIPNESQQIKAIKDLTETDYTGDLRIGARKAAEHIRNHYMLALDKAPFSRVDADLLPGAGACENCPKRTGANPELFSDVKSADVCTDAPCYHKKEEAHGKQLVAEASAKGHTVIAGKEAEELATQQYSHGPSPKLKGYRRLDHADDSPTDQPLRKIIGKQMKADGIDPVMIENPRKKGELLACLPNEVALRLLKAVEAQATAPESKNVSKEVREMADAKKAKAEERATAQYEQAWRDALVACTWAEVKSGDSECFSIDVHRYLVRQEAARLTTEQAESIAARLDLGKVGAHSAVIDYAKTTPHPQLLHLLIIMERTASVQDRGYLDRPANEGLMLVAHVALLDKLPVVIADLKAEARAKYLPEPVKAAAPETTSTPNPAAQATTTREGGKGKGTKGKTTPAAQARATAPKTSKAEASAQIAAELAALEGQIQAPRAQGNEGAPAPSGGLAVTAAPSNTAALLDPSLAWPKLKTPRTSTATDSAAAPGGEASADVGTGATVKGGELAAGVQVKIKPNARGPKQAPHVGKTGHIVRGINPLVWEVSIPREKRSVPWVVTFHVAELEVVNA
ncbi:MAG: ParB/RepB/Spo0J family partition protein [Acidovorax sp.]|nr:ParB/RepB/Spo0J family partition protein [Acidovorax sp.]